MVSGKFYAIYLLGNVNFLNRFLSIEPFLWQNFVWNAEFCFYILSLWLIILFSDFMIRIQSLLSLLVYVLNFLYL